MPIYGDNNIVYGSPLVYGQESVGLRFVLEVDWLGDGDFSGVSEYPYLQNMAIERGRKYFIQPGGKGFSQAEVGTAKLKMQNRDGRYNPYNISSPLHPYVRPRQLFRLRALHGTTIYPLIYGRTTNINPLGGMKKSANIDGVDGWNFLQEPISVPIQENQDSADLLNLILDEISWPVLWGRDIGAGAETLGYWWADRKSAKNELHSLAHAELGQVWISNNGNFSFRSRHYISTTVATITDEDVDKEAGYSIAQPWDVIKNKVSVQAYPKVLQAFGTLWQLEEKTRIPNGARKEIWVDYTYNNENVPAIGVETSPSDFTANANEDGSGANLTSGFDVTIYPFSKRAKVVLENNSGSDAYITLLRVKGEAITTPYTQSLYSENLISQQTYGTMEFDLDEPWLQDINTAQNFADFLSAFLSNPRPYFECWLLPNNPLQLGIDLEQRYELEVDELNINGAYKVIWYGHYWDLEKDGTQFRTRVLFEPIADISSSTYMQFPYQFEVNSDFAL